MSVIAIVLEKDAYSSVSAAKLHRALNITLHDVKQKWVNCNPVLEEEIFKGDCQQHAAHIRTVLKAVSEDSLAAEFYELPSGECYAGTKNLDIWLIDAFLVERILSAVDEEIERQLDK